tara:strand:+ start:303 stop:515 length:213 start_codon:yes stop_codon:yes gene_type:complete
MKYKEQNKKSKFRFSKQKVYFSEETGVSYHYQGKNSGGVFMFLTTGKNKSSGMFNGYESEMERLNLQEKK